MDPRKLRLLVLLTLALLVSALAVAAYAGQDRPAPVDPVRELTDEIRSIASRERNARRSFAVQADARRLLSIADRIDAARRTPTRPPPVDPVRPPPSRPPPTTTPPPAGPWVDPGTLFRFGPLTPILGSPAPLWGTMLDKLPAVLDKVEIAAQAPGSPVIPCLVQGAHQGTMRWSTFWLHGAPGADGVNRARWGARIFDGQGFELSDFLISDIPDEHGWYANTIGGFKMRRGMFKGLGSQAVQIAGAKPGTARGSETGLANWQAYVDAHRWEWQELTECAVIECGQPTGGRPSYALSFFGDVPNPVRLERCFVETKTAFHTDSSGQPADSYGAFMAHNRLRVEVLETALLYANGDRDTVQLWGIGDGDPTTVDILLRGSRIEGRGIDIRMAQPGDCQIVIDGCTGGARVTVSTAPFVAGPVPASAVIYQGGVNQWYTKQ